jgi:cob(I)alamin adenosyltransferase
MGYRLSKIYTRTGDQGTTGLADGNRISKDHPKIIAAGSVDELNSMIGLVLAELRDGNTSKLLSGIQHTLFDLGAELSLPPGNDRIRSRDVDNLEQALDEYNEPLGPLKEFILPGGSRAGALCHVARTVCRRAERDLVSLNREEPVATTALAYLNRLSDLLFVLARAINRQDGRPDVLWKPAAKE